MNRLIPCLAILFLVACGDSTNETGQEATPPSPATQSVTQTAAGPGPAADLLNRIDAEPAMLWLSLEPLPKALLDGLWQQLSMASDLNQQAYEDMAEATDDPLLRALFNELSALDSPESWAERGIAIEGVAGAHTIGLFPLLHWELSDADAFAATLARVEEESETTLPRREIDGEELVWLPLDDLGMALHHDEQFVTIGLVADRPDLLRRVANLDKPQSALQIAQVNAFNSARGLRNDNAGFVDFQRLVGQLLDGEDEWLVEARAQGALAELAADPACRAELDALTGIFPRKVFGTTHVDERSMSVLARFETSPEFGRRMASMADSPVALTTGNAGLLYAGLAFNIVAGRDFARDLVAGWVENPPECFLFAGVAEQSGDWQLALNRPIPPLVTNLHGLRLHIDTLTLANGELAEMAGTVALFMRNPQMMLGMAQMFSPELASLDLRPGGEPQPLPPGLVPNLDGIAAWLGLSETGLGLAMGDDSRLPSALEAGPSDRHIFAGGLDLSAYSELMQLGLANLPGGEQQAAEAAETMELLAAIYSYLHKSVALSEDGIDFLSGFEIAD